MSKQGDDKMGALFEKWNLAWFEGIWDGKLSLNCNATSYFEEQSGWILPGTNGVS